MRRPTAHVFLFFIKNLIWMNILWPSTLCWQDSIYELEKRPWDESCPVWPWLLLSEVNTVYTMYTTQCIQCILYSVYFTVYTIQCTHTVYTMHLTNPAWPWGTNTGWYSTTVFYNFFLADIQKFINCKTQPFSSSLYIDILIFWCLSIARWNISYY